MNFAQRDTVVAYNALLETCGKTDPSSGFDISMSDFSDGFTILGFNLESSSQESLDYWGVQENAHCRLDLKFGRPLPEAVNVILFGLHPSNIYIDNARNVTCTSQ